MTGTERGHELNFTDDPVIGQSRVICIASIRWDCCWQGMGICRWSVCQILVAFSLSLFSQAEIYWPPLRSCKNVCVLKNGKRCEVSIRHNWHSRTFLFYIQDVFHESKSHKNNMSYWYYAEKKIEFDILVIWASQLYSFIVSKRKRGERSKRTSVTPCQLDPMPDFVRT